jgi:hypothetical protein
MRREGTRLAAFLALTLRDRRRVAAPQARQRGLLGDFALLRCVVRHRPERPADVAYRVAARGLRCAAAGVFMH